MVFWLQVLFWGGGVAQAEVDCSRQGEVVGELREVVRGQAVPAMERPLVETSQTFPGHHLLPTPEESGLLRRRELGVFWRTRVGKDPVARIGLALWGTDEQLRDAIESTGIEAWLPRSNVFSRMGAWWYFPPGVTTRPKTVQETVDFWRGMAAATMKRVDAALAKTGVVDPAELAEVHREMGQQLAEAHVLAVEEDARESLGLMPGVLSCPQVAAYHHEVFARFGLPETTYGGTPYRWVPNRLELAVIGGLYAPDADPEWDKVVDVDHVPDSP